MASTIAITSVNGTDIGGQVSLRVEGYISTTTASELTAIVEIQIETFTCAQLNFRFKTGGANCTKVSATLLSFWVDVLLPKTCQCWSNLTVKASGIVPSAIPQTVCTTTWGVGPIPCINGGP